MNARAQARIAPQDGDGVKKSGHVRHDAGARQDSVAVRDFDRTVGFDGDTQVIGGDDNLPHCDVGPV